MNKSWGEEQYQQTSEGNKEPHSHKHLQALLQSETWKIGMARGRLREWIIMNMILEEAYLLHYNNKLSVKSLIWNH